MNLKEFFRDSGEGEVPREVQDMFNSWVTYSQGRDEINWSKRSLDTLRTLMVIGYRHAQEDYNAKTLPPVVAVEEVVTEVTPQVVEVVTKKKRRRRRK